MSSSSSSSVFPLLENLAARDLRLFAVEVAARTVTFAAYARRDVAASGGDISIANDAWTAAAAAVKDATPDKFGDLSAAAVWSAAMSAESAAGNAAIAALQVDWLATYSREFQDLLSEVRKTAFEKACQAEKAWQARRLHELGA